MSELQSIVDALATRLGRPVGVDDWRFAVVAYSAHGDAVDGVRLASILQREAPRAATDWLTSLGIADSESFVRVPANATLGMAPRLCVPIRFDDRLLGYIWIVEESATLTAAELEDTLAAAGELSVELYRARLLAHDERERERELTARALGVRGDDCAAALGELIDHGLLARSQYYTVMAVRVRHPSGGGVPQDVGARIAAAAEQLRRRVSPGHLLVLVDGAAILAASAHDDPEEGFAQGVALQELATVHLAGQAWEALVGVSVPAPVSAAGLDGARRQAVRAARLAERVGEVGPVAVWGRLGAYRVLAGLAADREVDGLIPDAFWRLLASVDAGSLVPTLTSYLEHAGDARAAANELFLHRSSLYARLRRIEEITGADLADGDERLELHLGLRLWRMSATSPR